MWNRRHAAPRGDDVDGDVIQLLCRCDLKATAAAAEVAVVTEMTTPAAEVAVVTEMTAPAAVVAAQQHQRHSKQQQATKMTSTQQKAAASNGRQQQARANNSKPKKKQTLPKVGIVARHTKISHTIDEWDTK